MFDVIGKVFGFLGGQFNALPDFFTIAIFIGLILLWLKIRGVDFCVKAICRAKKEAREKKQDERLRKIETEMALREQLEKFVPQQAQIQRRIRNDT